MTDAPAGSVCGNATFCSRRRRLDIFLFEELFGFSAKRQFFLDLIFDSSHLLLKARSDEWTFLKISQNVLTCMVAEENFLFRIFFDKKVLDRSNYWLVESSCTRSGQSVTASDFGSNGPRFKSGRGRCVESLDKALYSHCPKEKPSH